MKLPDFSRSVSMKANSHRTIQNCHKNVHIGMVVPGGAIRDDQLVEGLKIGYLKRCGFWHSLNHFRETGKMDGVFTIYMWITLVGYAPLLAASVAGPFFAQVNSIEEWTVIMLNPLTASQVVVKVVGVCYGLGTHARLMDLFVKNYLKCVPDDKRKQVDSIMAKAVKNANFLAYLPICSNSMTMATWCLLPILRSGFMRETLGIGIFGKDKNHNKIMGIWYPVDVDVSPWTETIYVYEACSGVWATFTVTLFESTLIQLTVLLNGYMRALAFLLSEHKPSPKRYEEDHAYLLSCIAEHKKLLSAVEDMRNLFHVIVTLQLASGTAILIMSIFNFFLGTNDGDLVQQFKFLIYLIYVLLEVALYCYVGSDLEDVSADIGFAAYSSEWYTMGKDYCKSLQMIIIRSKRSSALKAAWYPVNYDCLTSILQMAYSTSMLLFQVTDTD